MPKIKSAIIDLSIKRYRQVAIAIALFPVFTGAFSPPITIDTYPENTLDKSKSNIIAIVGELSCY
jgi:hypothetical protein